MLPYRRIHALPSGRAETRYAALCRDGLRVYVTGSSGVVFDTRVLAPALPQRDPSNIAQVTLALKGDYLVRRERARAMPPGDLFAETNFPWDERWGGDSFEVLVVEWTRAYGDFPSAPARGRVDPRTLVVAKDLARSLLRADWKSGMRGAVDFLARLRSLGVPLAPLGERDLDEGISAFDRTFSNRLGEVESRLHDRPMWIDLESMIDRSARHLRRSHSRILAALSPFEPRSFRQILRHRRVRTAGRFVTAHDVPLEEVAHACGYGSVRALIFAMHQEGLPTPGSIRRACAHP